MSDRFFNPQVAAQGNPTCDAECMKKKELDGLKAAMESATTPEDREKARLAYYTRMYGQEWLQKEKERIAKEEVEPMLMDYRTRFDALKQQQKTQSMFVTLMNQNMSDSHFVDEKLRKQQSNTSALVRLNELTPTEAYFWFFPMLLDILLVVLGLVVVYLAYIKFGKMFKSADVSESIA
jgi:hypothetical protein